MQILQNRQYIFLQSLIEGKREITDDEVESRKRILHLERLSASYQFAEIAPSYDGVSPEDKDRIIYEYQSIVETLLSGMNFWLYTDCYNNVGVLFSRTIPDEAFYVELREKLYLKFGMDVYIGVGSVVEKLSQINRSAAEAKEMLSFKFQYSEKGVILHSTIVKFQYNSLLGTDIVFDRVIGCFMDCNIGKMSQRLDELIDHVRKRPNVSRTSIRRTLVELVIRIINVASNAGVDVDKILGDRDPYHWVMSQNHTEKITEWIMELSISFIKEIHLSTDTVEKKNIKKAILYIDRNLHDTSLGLQSVSEYVELTSPYLSQLFKDETGIGINAFIKTKRLERASYLLKNSELSIENISNQCGFSSVQYFSKVFKDKTGMAPLEYRKS